MISQKHRFHGLGSLRYVYSKGRVVRSTNLGLKFIPNSRRTTWRAAVVVSKKVSKSAVIRNRLRRRIYEAVRLAGLSEQGDQGIDLVFTVYNDSLLTASPDELRTQVQKLLADAQIASTKAR